jgi:hypothetical protein
LAAAAERGVLFPGTDHAYSDGTLLFRRELSASALGGMSSFERLGNRRELKADVFEKQPLLGPFHFFCL